MNFSNALDNIKSGQKLARKGWNGKDMFVFLVNNSEFLVNREPLITIFKEGTKIKYNSHIDICTADGTISVWQPSMGDVMADDWSVV